MTITHKLSLDFQRPGIVPLIGAVQGEQLTRRLEITLLSDGVAFPPPEGTAPAVRYRTHRGAGGIYDTLEDGTPACTLSGNVLTLTLAAAVTAQPGLSVIQAVLYSQGAVLCSFPVNIRVEADPSAGKAAPESYTNLQTQIADTVTAWLDAHPEATTTVADGAVTEPKLSQALRNKLDFAADRSALSVIRDLLYSAVYTHNVTAALTALDALLEQTPQQPEEGVIQLGSILAVTGGVRVTQSGSLLIIT